MDDGLKKPLSPDEWDAFNAVAESLDNEMCVALAANEPEVRVAVEAMLQNASEVSDETDPFVVECNRVAAEAATLHGLSSEEETQEVVSKAIQNWLAMEGLDEDG